MMEVFVSRILKSFIAAATCGANCKLLPTETMAGAAPESRIAVGKKRALKFKVSRPR
ncbi:hypothetical protein [uncultured Alistipes sp.]|uniref:hypothetical protein n=1 Tax=uncultured Alistipes sp. TaxID=538949 RepID=UPI00272BB938|nr:hypothetical protein [uncultured Alistipes sp.]